MAMATDSLTPGEARDLARIFHDVAAALGNYRFSNWDGLDAGQRAKLENLQWTLLNYSSDFAWMAISLTLDSLQATLKNISDATLFLNNAIKNVQAIEKVLKVATAVVGLAAAISTGQVVAIATALDGVAGATKS